MNQIARVSKPKKAHKQHWYLIMMTLPHNDENKHSEGNNKIIKLIKTTGIINSENFAIQQQEQFQKQMSRQSEGQRVG